MSLKKWLFLRFFNFYPAFLGAGIRVKISKDLKTVNVRMKLRFWNRNYVGTHFGGSLYAMTDPFFMFLLIEHLGLDYILWDQKAEIMFKSPGKGTVYATFHLPDEAYDRLRQEAESEEKIHPVFPVDVTDAEGRVVATVNKTIYIRKKRKKPVQGRALVP